MAMKQKIEELLYRSYLCCKMYRDERLRLEYIKPSDCSVYHWLPFHCKGYAYCLKSWEEVYRCPKDNELYYGAQCFVLAELLEYPELWAGWKPSEGLKHISKETIARANQSFVNMGTGVVSVVNMGTTPL